MSQLKMINPSLCPVEENAKNGLSVISTAELALPAIEIAESWAEICEELNQKYDPELFDRLMLQDVNVLQDSIFFVKDRNGRFISTAALRKTKDPDIIGLHMVGTAGDAKGLGAGCLVSAHCVNTALQKGFRKMSLWTDDFRIPAIKIYLRLGFLPVLFEEDMEGRWNRIAEQLGLSELKVLDFKGKEAVIKLN